MQIRRRLFPVLLAVSTVLMLAAAANTTARAMGVLYEEGHSLTDAFGEEGQDYAVYDSGSETMTASAVAADGGASSETENAYLKRLKELDAQIRKSREAQSAANTAGAGGNSQARNAADNELKLWDSELSTIYNEILKSLDEKEVQDLVTAERQWMKNRDAAAVEAAKNSAGGSLESVEYTASLAETTRARAYELVGLYASVLTERE